MSFDVLSFQKPVNVLYICEYICVCLSESVCVCVSYSLKQAPFGCCGHHMSSVCFSVCFGNNKSFQAIFMLTTVKYWPKSSLRTKFGSCLYKNPYGCTVAYSAQLNGVLQVLCRSMTEL